MDGPSLLQEFLTKRKQCAADLARRSDGRVTEGELSRYLHGKRRPGVAKAFLIEELTARAVPAKAWTPTRRNKRSKAA